MGLVIEKKTSGIGRMVKRGVGYAAEGEAGELWFGGVHHARADACSKNIRQWAEQWRRSILSLSFSSAKCCERMLKEVGSRQERIVSALVNRAVA